MPQLAQVLLCGQDDAVAALGIARLIHDEHPTRMRPQIGVRLPLREPAPIERLGVPGRIVHEMVQPLSVRPRHDGPQFDQRLVVLAGQEQPDEILAQRRALLVAGEQLVKEGTKLVNRLGRGRRRLTLGGHRSRPLSRQVAGSGLQRSTHAKRSIIHA
jgi:hypothetical protein